MSCPFMVTSVASLLLVPSVRSSAIAVSPTHSTDSATGTAALVIMPRSVPTPGFQLLALLLRLVVPLPIHLALLQLRLLLLRILLFLPTVADPPAPSDASAVGEVEMPNGKYVPSTDDDSDPSSMDAVAASGDDEVVLAVSAASTSGSPRRRRKRRRRTVSSAVPCVLVDMDTSEVEVPGHKQFKTFRGVWEDVVSWEELRSRKSRYRVVVTPHEPSSTPSHSLPSLFLLLLLLRYLRLPLFHPLFFSNGSVVDSVPTPTPERPRASSYAFNKPRLW